MLLFYLGDNQIWENVKEIFPELFDMIGEVS